MAKMSELNVLFAKHLSELFAVQKDMENVIHPPKSTWDTETINFYKKVQKTIKKKINQSNIQQQARNKAFFFFLKKKKNKPKFSFPILEIHRRKKSLLFL